MSTVIPGLTTSAFVSGSRHTAPTPTLLRSVVDENSAVDFEWRAVGTSVYAVTARGKLRVDRWKRSGVPASFAGLDARCTCPDGERQRDATESSGRLTVCKHGEAALESVLDPGAAARWECEARRADGARREALRLKSRSEAASASSASGSGASATYRDDLVDLLLSKGAEEGDGPECAFCFESSVELPTRPGPGTMRIDGVGDVALPISKVGGDQVVEASEVAPFGRGLDTVVDEDYRRARQIDASRITLGRDLEVAVRKAASAAADALGASDWAVEAHLYKLVLYEEGGFFRPHKDTEKEKGMFATLAVQLPVEGGHKGGSLVVRHAGHVSTMDWSAPLPDTDSAREERRLRRARTTEESTVLCGELRTGIGLLTTEEEEGGATVVRGDAMSKLAGLRPTAAALTACLDRAARFASDEDAIEWQSKRFPCAAFYADCTHELTPVTSGRRVVLLYNLVRTSPGVAYTNPSGADSVSLREIVTKWSGHASAPAKLVIPLDHKYTETNFDFHELKGADRARSDLLRSCDGLTVNLALFEKHVSGSADSYGGGWRRGCRSYYDSDDDGDGASMDEIYDTDLKVSKWISSSGGSDELKECLNLSDIVEPKGSKDKSELLFGEIFGDEGDNDPDKREYEPYTGNAGPSLDYWYYTAAFVVWPSEAKIKLAYSVSLKAALDEVTNKLSRNPSSGREAVQQLLDCMETMSFPAQKQRSRYSFGSTEPTGQAKMHSVIPLIEQFPEFAQRFLSLITPTSERRTTAVGLFDEFIARGIGRLIKTAGWQAIGPRVTAIINASKETNFKHHIVLIEELGPSASNFAEILDATSAAAITRMDNNDFSPAKDLVLRLVKEDFRPSAKCQNAVATLLKSLCEREEALTISATVLKALHKGGYSIDDSISSDFQDLITSVSKRPDASPNNVCLEYLICTWKLETIARQCHRFDIPLLLSTINFMKVELSQQQEVSPTSLSALGDLVKELGSREGLRGAVHNTATMLTLLKDVAWGLKENASESWSSVLQALGSGIEKFGGEDMVFSVLTAFVENASNADLECLSRHDSMQALLQSSLTKLEAKCNHNLTVDYSVANCSAAEGALRKANQARSNYRRDVSGHDILHGQFRGIAQARVKAAQVDKALGWRGSAIALGTGRNACVSIIASERFKRLVEQDENNHKNLSLIRKYSPLLVAKPIPSAHQSQSKKRGSVESGDDGEPKRHQTSHEQMFSQSRAGPESASRGATASDVPLPLQKPSPTGATSAAAAVASTAAKEASKAAPAAALTSEVVLDLTLDSDSDDSAVKARRPGGVSAAPPAKGKGDSKPSSSPAPFVVANNEVSAAPKSSPLPVSQIRVPQAPAPQVAAAAAFAQRPSAPVAAVAAARPVLPIDAFYPLPGTMLHPHMAFPTMPTTMNPPHVFPPTMVPNPAQQQVFFPPYWPPQQGPPGNSSQRQANQRQG